jgi:hypothetical protein
MGKKLNLSLRELKVTSFVTSSLSENQKGQVKGGEDTRWTYCSVPALCSEESCPEVTCTMPTHVYTCTNCTCYESCGATSPPTTPPCV